MDTRINFEPQKKMIQNSPVNVSKDWISYTSNIEDCEGDKRHMHNCVYLNIYW